MLIDLDGVPAGGATMRVLVDRPPAGGYVHAGVLQLGFPSAAPDPGWPFGPGVEIWSTGVVSQLVLYPPVPGTLAETFVLPPGPQSFTLQFVTAMVAPLCGGQAIGYAASPALLVGYP